MTDAEQIKQFEQKVKEFAVKNGQEYYPNIPKDAYLELGDFLFFIGLYK
jgi:hypothetical protein